MIADAMLVFVVGIGAQAQGLVVDKASTPERVSKNTSLLIGRVKPILVRSFLLHV